MTRDRLYSQSHRHAAAYTKALDYPVIGHWDWAKAKVVSSASGTRTDTISVHSPTRYSTEPAQPSRVIVVEWLGELSLNIIRLELIINLLTWFFYLLHKS